MATFASTAPSQANPVPGIPSTLEPDVENGNKATKEHAEVVPGEPDPSSHRKWKLSRTGDGDTALALFSNPDELREILDPKEERALQLKIDLMILPYLAVCYAFFYIDKTTLSYAAIFGIQKDLNLHGTEYSWLSSIFYFGFLIWACKSTTLETSIPADKPLSPHQFHDATFSNWKISRDQYLHVGLLPHAPSLRTELQRTCCSSSSQRCRRILQRS